MIISHESPLYRLRWERSGDDRHNGAYYYSREIVRNIVPRVRTDRHWVTIHSPGECLDHSIVFIHNNLRPDRYDWLGVLDDLVLVCGVPSTCDKVAHLGRAVYLPLSVDVAEVEGYRRPKDRGTAYVGRAGKRGTVEFGCDLIEGLPRDELLAQMARYERVYAVGRCAIEAKVLGCEILPYDERFPDPSVWQVVDNVEAAQMLQAMLDGIDG